MTMKKVAVFTTAGVAALGLAVGVPFAVYAQTAPDKTSFVQELATKLGVDEAKVQSAVDSIRSEHQAARRAEMQKAIETALASGKITQRQADILKARMEIQPEIKVDRAEVRKDLAGLTAEQRQAQREELRAAHEADVLKALNEKGLNVTQAELDALQTLVRDSGLFPLPPMGRRMGKF
jgi:hypothetical protein